MNIGLFSKVFGFVQRALPLIGLVENLINRAKAGEEKKRIVLDSILLAPEVIELIKNGDVVDEAEFRRGVGLINDGYVAVLNSLKRDVPSV